jgi:hypothetical protein
MQQRRLHGQRKVGINLSRGKGGKAGFAARWCMISGDFAGATHH